MKKLIIFLLPYLVAIAIAFFAYEWLLSLNDVGYVIMGMEHWYLEKSFVDFALYVTIAFFVLYLLLRVLGRLYEMPFQLKQRGDSIKFNRSQEALIAGLVDNAEGNFERAELVLVKHADRSGAPLLHYLTAARAAQARGALDKRDQYLRKASDYAPDSSITVGLTQAELHLSSKEFDEALATLTLLHSIDPAHAGVLKLLHKTYQHIGDWQALQKLIPSLHRNKVLMEVEVKLLEAETFCELLKQAADEEKIAELWDEVPLYIKTMHTVSSVYFAAMIRAGAGAKIENSLTKALSLNWDEKLLLLYGDIVSDDTERQLQMAELWLPLHPDNALLFMVLGKLSVQCNQVEKAKSYLTKSISAKPSVQAYQTLGDLMMAQNDKDSASQCYKLGLELSLANQ